MSGARFATTRWSLVLAAQGAPTDTARQALADLCHTYWYPLYAYVRRSGHDVADAEDLVQGFFAAFLGAGHVRGVEPGRGRFRSFLLGAFRNHLAHERERAQAQKRGGGRPVIALDVMDAERRLQLEPADSETPERAFERAFCRTLLATARHRLRDEYADRDRAEVYDALAGQLGGPGSRLPHCETAERLQISEVAVKVALHRLRCRFKEVLREEVAATLDEGADVTAELRALMAVL
ncbi:MAG: RNA polymerase subunit sigma-24 [Planctomycetes bacterium]|nr:RNA polymerase subunit sigma-24 [Planctomycetota bacterium]